MTFAIWYIYITYYITMRIKSCGLWFVVPFPFTRLELTRREALIWRSALSPWQMEKRMSIKSASRVSQMHFYLDVSTKLCVHLNLISLVDCLYKSDLICGRLEKQKESQLLQLVFTLFLALHICQHTVMEKTTNNHLGYIYIYIHSKWL